MQAFTLGGMTGTKFNGNRYRKDNDPATMVLFDKNGYIAGIQAGVSYKNIVLINSKSRIGVCFLSMYAIHASNSIMMLFLFCFTFYTVVHRLHFTIHP